MLFTTQQNYTELLKRKKNNEPMGLGISLLNVDLQFELSRIDPKLILLKK